MDIGYHTTIYAYMLEYGIFVILSSMHGKGGHLARIQNWLLHTRIRQEFAVGTKDLLLIDNYLFTTYSVRKMLDASHGKQLQTLQQIQPTITI